MIYEKDIDYIMHNLYIGNYKSCNMNYINQYNIKYIICVMVYFDERKIQKNTDLVYYHIPIKDEKYCKNINIDYKILFDDISNLINNLLKLNKGAVLVHCKRGHHRSAAILAYYLSKFHKLELNKIIKYIKNKRPLALRRNCCIMNNLLYYCK